MSCTLKPNYSGDFALGVRAAEVFGGSIDWFSSTQLPAPAAATDAGNSSSWPVNDAVSNGHIDVWPSLTLSGCTRISLYSSS